MLNHLTDIEKKLAASEALSYIKSGMTIGLGTGSTVNFLIELLGEKVRAGLEIIAVSTSINTSKIASTLGINIKDLNEVDSINVTIDGADEVDQNLNGIKGGGGALLNEKIVASNSEKNIWIVDSTKYVNKLGQFPLPVEIVQFGSDQLYNKLKRGGYNPEFRKNNGQEFITDGDHYILDLHINEIEDAESLNFELLSIPGVVETGLFIDVCDLLIVGGKSECDVINKKKPVS